MEAIKTLPALHREHGVEWSFASRALPGETVSGDLHLVARARYGVLIAVIDGLGHGDEATAAAQKAATLLAAQADEFVVTLMHRCHEALLSTRGAAMTLLALNLLDRTATAVGVGNVEMMLIRGDTRTKPPRESALLRNGVVGYRLPTLQASVMALYPGDVVVFATDGVREDFADGLNPADPLPRVVDRIIGQKYRGTDDALVLAGRVLHDYER